MGIELLSYTGLVANSNLISVLSFLFGSILIFYGAEMLIDNSKLIAESYKVAPENEKVKRFIIGVTIIAFGTSLPELAVSSSASFKGTSAIALGNVLGSNVANIGFVLGLIVLFKRIDFNFLSFKTDLNILLVITMLTIFLAWFNLLNTVYVGIFFLTCFLLFLSLQFYELFSIKETADLDSDNIESNETSFRVKYIFFVFVGMLVLGVGSEMFILGALGIAKLLGAHIYSVSLTLVACGTSLPELVTSMTAIRKDEPNFVIGNVVGSNIINILLVLGTSIFILPIDSQQMLISSNSEIMQGSLNIRISLLFVLLMTVIFYFFCFKFSQIGRKKGIFLFALYLIFIILNFYY